MSDPGNNTTVIWFQMSIRPQMQRARNQPKHYHPPIPPLSDAWCFMYTRIKYFLSLVAASESRSYNFLRLSPDSSMSNVCKVRFLHDPCMNQTNVEENAGMYALCVDGTHGEMYHVQDNEDLKLALRC